MVMIVLLERSTAEWKLVEFIGFLAIDMRTDGIRPNNDFFMVVILETNQQIHWFTMWLCSSPITRAAHMRMSSHPRIGIERIGSPFLSRLEVWRLDQPNETSKILITSRMPFLLKSLMIS